jgi:hypothetical protein
VVVAKAVETAAVARATAIPIGLAQLENHQMTERETIRHQNKFSFGYVSSLALPTSSISRVPICFPA